MTLQCNYNNCNTVIIGDLNSRCGELSECMQFDENVPEFSQFSDIFHNPVSDSRISCDKVINALGRQLVELS